MRALLKLLPQDTRTKPHKILQSFSYSHSNQGPPIRVAETDDAGRGVFATRYITSGELIHKAKPLVSHPAISKFNSVCYLCLKKLNPLHCTIQESRPFCSQACADEARGFCAVESSCDWSEFDEHCGSLGLKYPLMAKRLACMVAANATAAESISILQPSVLPREMLLEMEKGFELLSNSFAITQIAQQRLSFLTKKWYIDVLARLRINAFRVELTTASYEDLLSSAAACVEGESAVGNAVYILPSMYNHDCDPNAHIVWTDNAHAKMMALRNVEKGEELRICYIDASIGKEGRKSILRNGFGFTCNCPRCVSEY